MEVNTLKSEAADLMQLVQKLNQMDDKKEVLLARAKLTGVMVGMLYALETQKQQEESA